MTERELKDKAETFFIEKNYLHSGLADRPRIINWMAEFAKSEVEKAVAAKDKEIEALKAENKRQRDALLDIEDDANAKAVLGETLNTKSILMSARHGLGLAGMEVNRD